MDHHSRWGSVAELREAFREFAARRRRSSSRPTEPRRPGRGQASRGFAADAPGRPSWASPSPATTTCSTPAPRSRRWSWPASTSSAPRRRSPTSPASSGRLELKGCARRHPRLRRLRPPPDRGPGRPLGPARAGPRAPDRRLPAPPLLAHQGLRRGVRRRPGARRRSRRPRRLPGARGAGRRAGRGQRPARSPRPRRSGWGEGRSAGCPTRGSRRRARGAPGPQPGGRRRGPGAGHDRRRRRLQARRGAGRGGQRMSAPRRACSATSRWPG